jgi:glycosyltransferase involved in cell wall biosynthesis
LKILHLPTPGAGHSWGLAQGEKKRGLESTVMVTQDSWIHYPCDINLGWDKKNNAAKLINAFRTLFRIRNKYDIFHFNFGTSLIDIPQAGLPLFDLSFYPDNKKIFFTYNGCDARQKFKTLQRVDFSACHDNNCYGGMCTGGKRDKLRKNKIEKAARYAHHMFALNPDLLRFLPEGSTFLPYAVAEWDNIETTRCRVQDRITVVHSPTNRAAKGSDIIIEAVNNLKSRHSNIEFILVENTPHKEALSIYKKAHLIIDQVLIGWYGGFAVEAMKMGKAVAVFIREEDLKFIPSEMVKDLKDAVINITPSTIQETLETYLLNTDLLVQKSQAASEYVFKWHDPVYVAGITKSVYES